MLNAIADAIRSMREGANPSFTSLSALETAPVAVSSGGLEYLTYGIEQVIKSDSAPVLPVGRLPPEPPTLRGRTGAVLIRLIKRCLFWYTDQINEMYSKIGDLFRRSALQLLHLEQQQNRQGRLVQEAARQAEVLDREVKNIRGDLTELRNSLAMVREHLTSVRDTLPRDFDSALRAALQQERAAARQEFEVALRNERELMRTELESKTAGLAALSEAIRNERTLVRSEFEAKVASFGESARKAELLAHQTPEMVRTQESRNSLMMRRASRKPSVASAAGSSGSFLNAADDELSEMYVAFEDAFRGSRHEIKERVSEYLPLLTGKRIGTSHMPVLDLGCGRGEWLEVLGESGLSALGVDSNQSCARECEARGLSVRMSDALKFLEELPEQSQGAVTAFHVVEYMPFAAILNLLDEAVRVLKPGGLLILETPNPANLIVGANTLYLDPTHIRPLPADVMRFFVETRGFCNIETRLLHPFPACYRLEAEPNSAAALLNELVFGARDYAIIAERA
jgi:2-polyprenyl-3-methyl-5-hydroxy-6-metoxy-1,4-benzoquinol methylase